MKNQPLFVFQKIMVLAAVLALLFPVFSDAASSPASPPTGFPPEAAAKAMTLPPGFSVTLFAGEPDIKQPVAFAIDDRGRLWVAENYSYPIRQPEGQGRDRIIIFEDKDGDGRFDQRSVFVDNLNMVTALELGFGGVWVGAAPHLLFIPFREGEGKPSGPPQVLLDGWGYQDTHNTLSTFVWGPDGWLYGGHGVASHSRVGEPGAPDSARQRLDGSVWRYHPTQKIFEVFSEGQTNPWGVDFDDYGQLFVTGCVIPHLWHVIQGARYQRPFGQHQNPHTYDDIKTIADHRHWAGENSHAGREGYRDERGELRSFEADYDLGGGHAHAGGMIYLGDNWPAEYRGDIFMFNLHGHRVNRDRLERRGSGFAGRHASDFLLARDTWSLFLNLQYGPDGSAFAIDFHEKNLCHTTKPDFYDRSNGRIYKVTHGGTNSASPQLDGSKLSSNSEARSGTRGTRPSNDLQKLSDVQLVELQLHQNDWFVRHARRILQERAQARGPNTQVHEALLKILNENPDITRKLRALWALHVTGGLSKELALELLGNSDEYVRAWAIQFSAEDRKLSGGVLGKLAQLAKSDASPVVRLYVAAALQRLAPEDRWDTYAALLQHSEDAGDHNLPLMAWYAGEALAATQPAKALPLAVEARLPKILSFTTRRIASLGTAEAHALIAATLASVDDAGKQLEMLSGLSAAFAGQRNVSAPRGWDAVEAKLAASPNVAVRALAQTLSLTFGSRSALAALRKTLADTSATVPARRAALDALVGVKDSELPPLLRAFLRDAELRGPSLRALAAYNDPLTPDAILAAYTSLDAAGKRDALNTLGSRPAFAKPLLAAVADGKIPAKDLTADVVRQLRGMMDADVRQQLTKAYGTFRETSADKKAETEKYRAIYRVGPPGEAGRGRVIFNRVCVQCHTLFDTGGQVGPDITGANRSDVNYLLENILDPNAVIPNEYRVSTVETKDGRSLTGIIKKQDEKALTIATANETVLVPRNEIDSQQQSELSMMPEGLLAGLNDQEFRDLIYYLTRPGQAPLPAEGAAK